MNKDSLLLYSNNYIDSADCDRILPNLSRVHGKYAYSELTDSTKLFDNASLYLDKLNQFSEDGWEFSELAVGNCINVFLLGLKNKFTPRVMESLEDKEGIFVDFTRGDNYIAFELYNDGDVVYIKKVGSNPTEVKDVEGITHHLFV